MRPSNCWGLGNNVQNVPALQTRETALLQAYLSGLTGVGDGDAVGGVGDVVVRLVLVDVLKAQGDPSLSHPPRPALSGRLSHSLRLTGKGQGGIWAPPLTRPLAAIIRLGEWRAGHSRHSGTATGSGGCPAWSSAPSRSTAGGETCTRATSQGQGPPSPAAPLRAEGSQEASTAGKPWETLSRPLSGPLQRTGHGTK